MTTIKLSPFKKILMSLLMAMLNATYHIDVFAYSILVTSNTTDCATNCKNNGHFWGHPLNCLNVVSIELHSGLVSYYANSNGKCLCLNSMEKQVLDNCGTAKPCSTYGLSHATGTRFHVLNTANSFNCASGYGNCTCNTGFYVDGHTCIQCPTGYRCYGGTLYPVGLSGILGRTMCSVGFYQYYKGQSTCNPCPAGYYGQKTGLSTCTPCASGHYTSGTATYSCTSCGQGFYQSMTGQSKCVQCPSLQSIQGASDSGATAITKCFLPGNPSYLYSDTFGKYKFATDCYYTS